MGDPAFNGDMARLDAWLWAVRLYKTRSEATAGCRGGHVRVNDLPGKAAQSVRAGDEVRVRREGAERIVEVVDATLVKRVGAAVAQQAYVDRTPPKPDPVPGMGGRIAVRDRGAGRPTKKERREVDRLRGR